MAKKTAKKVLMCLSGGVDSSVAAALLVKEGCQVTAAFMLNYDNNKPGSESCWLPDYRDATRVAAHLGIPIIKLDFTKEYKAAVLDYMFKEYEKGRTPNPDVLCNTFIKFGSWLEKAKSLGFDYIATGHYANIKALKHKNTRTVSLGEAKDKNKDQTYFLHQLNQEQLSKTLFPIGKYTKPEVRKLAKKFKLPTAEKEESMGICFVGEVPMDEFLKTRIKPKPGNIVTTQGEVVGKHDGLSFYTIGQRHLGVLGERSKEKGESNTKPLYVVAKRLDSNELVVGYEDDVLLFKKEIELSDLRWVGGQMPANPLKCLVRMRHRQEMQKAIVKTQEHENIKTVIVEFDKPQKAVTPGQFAVFYKNGECLGGGVIQ